MEADLSLVPLEELTGEIARRSLRSVVIIERDHDQFTPDGQAPFSLYFSGPEAEDDEDELSTSCFFAGQKMLRAAGAFWDVIMQRKLEK
jgi:hypothetical protein